MTATRLDALFAACRAEGRPAFLPFMTAGLPSPETSPAMYEAMADADGFEVGIPYSDPLMDGPTIQAAGQRSLRGGTTLAVGLDIVRQVSERTRKPTLVMTYSNVVFQVGPQSFAARIAEAGASGLIVADLPFEEAAPVQQAVEAEGLGMVLFAAPTTTDERLERLAAARPAFVYGVAEVGVTGEREKSGGRAAAMVERIRAVTDRPIVLGVGISTPSQARALAPLADGIIVGSALVREVLDAPDATTAARRLTATSGALAAALRP